MDDIFCKIIRGDVPAYKVYEDDTFIAILDREPVNPGHTILIPKEHCDNFIGFNENQLIKYGTAQKNVIEILQKNLDKVTGFTLYQSNGGGAYQTVPHSHLHIIPRYDNDFGYSTFDRGHNQVRGTIDDSWAQEVIKKINS